jgi:hypothetical protein
MLVVALALFAVAALFGVYMIMRVFKAAMPPVAAVIFHGLFAASGLVILVFGVVTGMHSTPVVAAAALLVIAALGGFLLLSFQLRKQTPPKPLAAIHALVAVAGFLVLAAVTFGYL